MTMFKSYPMPVLGNNDDIMGKFDLKLHYLLEPATITLECDFTLEHPTIAELIETGKAMFITEIICPATFFREYLNTKTSSAIKKIPSAKVRGQVTVHSYICASEDIPDYNPDDVHPDLVAGPTSVEPGEILAVAESLSFIADKEFDPLNAPVSSFVKIRKGTTKAGPMTIDIESDSIMIVLSHEDYKIYSEIDRKVAAGILHSALVLPALIEALSAANRNSSQYSGESWYQQIDNICRARNIDFQDALYASQRLLDSPVLRGLKTIKTTQGVEND